MHGVKCIEFTAVKSEVRLIYIYIDITGIDLFDRIVSMACAKVRLRCSWILLVLIYLNKMWVWQLPELNSDLHGYNWYCS